MPAGHGGTYEGDISDELGGGGRREVDRGAVLRRGLVAEEVDVLLLEELVTAELEGALEEVAGGRGAEAGQERAGTLLLDDLAEAADHALVEGGGVELDARLDAAGEALAAIVMVEGRSWSAGSGCRGSRSSLRCDRQSGDGIKQRTHQRE